MAPNTAVAFFLSGMALALIDIEIRRKHRPSEHVAMSVFFIALLAIVGHLYNVESLTRVSEHFIPMAFISALGFIVLCIGVLFSRPDQGIMRVITTAPAIPAASPAKSSGTAAQRQNRRIAASALLRVRGARSAAVSASR